MSFVNSALYSNPRAECVFLALVSAITWSFFDLMSGVNAPVDVYLIVIFIGLGITATGVCGGIFGGGRKAVLGALTETSWKGVVAVGVGASCSMLDNLLYIIAQKYVPVGDVALFFYLSFLYTSFVESAWRRRRPSIVRFVCLVLCAGGLLLVTQPSFLFHSSSNTSSASSFGYLMAFLTGPLYSANVLLISAFKEIPWFLWIIVQGVFLNICGVAGGAVSGVDFRHVLAFGVSLTTQSALDAVGRGYAVLSTQAYSATLAAVVGVTQVPLSYVWGWIWLSETMNVVKGVGIFVVLGSVLVVIVDSSREKWEEAEQKEKEEKKEEEKESNTKGEKQLLRCD